MDNVDKITYMYDTLIGLLNNDTSWYEYNETEIFMDYDILDKVYVLVFGRVTGIMVKENWVKSHRNYYIRNDEYFLYNNRIEINFNRSNDITVIDKTGQSTKELIFELQIQNVDNNLIELISGLNAVNEPIPDGHILYIPRIKRITEQANKFNLIRTGQIL